MQHLLKKRILFFGGKGGVGKTTCASAMALRVSRLGKRVLLVSTDPAHSTSDIFEKQFSAEEREVHPGVSGIELNAEVEAGRYIAGVKEQIAKLFSPNILKEAERQIELAATMPGVEEVALLDRIAELIVNRESAYDMLIFDTAPTGHTLRLLRMPELMTSWIHALAARRQNLINLEDKIQRRELEDRRGPDPVLEALEKRRSRLGELRSRLIHHNVTGFVLVLIPERLPIEETCRAVSLLQEFNVHVAGVIVNRVLPEELTGEFYQARRQQEQVYRDEIRQRFSQFPIQWIPQFESDVYGVKSLERVAGLLL